MQSESSPIVRLSTRDIAPADRLNYANWILSVADGAATTEVSATDPSAFELEATALELPAVTIVAHERFTTTFRSSIRTPSHR